MRAKRQSWSGLRLLWVVDRKCLLDDYCDTRQKVTNQGRGSQCRYNNLNRKNTTDSSLAFQHTDVVGSWIYPVTLHIERRCGSGKCMRHSQLSPTGNGIESTTFLYRDHMGHRPVHHHSKSVRKDNHRNLSKPVRRDRHKRRDRCTR